jgi:nitrite reductase (NADH) large subunit
MRLIVIGNGMVGQRLLEELADHGRYQITVLSEEPRPAYDRVNLSGLFGGKCADDLSLVEAGFFARHGIEVSLSSRVSRIDRERRNVQTEDGALRPYDRLVIATGSSAWVPPIPGNDRLDCFVYRTIEDLECIRRAAANASRGAVIGGGLLGLEAAKALKDLGLETSVVEFAPRLMAVQVDDFGGRLLQTRIAELGVGVFTGRNTTSIGDGAKHRHRLHFADGGDLETDLVVFSAGVRPRDELARSCGLQVAPRGGIVIDDECRTSDPDIFAIGECAAWGERCYGLVAPGYQMARVAAACLRDNDAGLKFTGADMSTKLKLLGVDVASLGDAHAVSDGARSCYFVDDRRQIYKKLVVSGDGRRLLGGILIGDVQAYGSLLQTMQTGLELSSSPEQLILAPAGQDEQSTGTAGGGTLPGAAQICTCNGVSRAALCSAIAAGSTTIAALKRNTRATSTCGGCAPLVAQILKAQLAIRGVSVTDHLCEHFPYSRQQLFHLVRVGQLRTFQDLISRHGRGLGCDICKPAIASIFASCWSQFVLDPDKASLQDSNDRFLANIQKDGTYSIVPRIAGGEITPQQLITIGHIAQRHRLYTKITGGQRIDMLGARVHQLPMIWRDLVEAGFESGHAYGKAVRTVKSCVGSAWCRYGVQDSVGLAIELENRYKGLRSPHKLKFGVSGCTRECAEAQSKDVGVVATEKGWNLYVCGNGGMKPRHAELLASDLDKPTLIRFIDRLLIFYIRTADRLQRTSVWCENLEGGLEYLRQVICRDSLGIGAELEADMRHAVESYECEWKRAINDSPTLSRFRHFVNSDREDEGVRFVDERGQPRPARPEERAHLQEAG